MNDSSGARRRAASVVRPAIRELSAYQAPPAGDGIKLDAMENPYELPPALKSGWLEVMREAALNRYPDPSGAQLKERLRRVFDLPAGSSILLGNGSDEIIQMIQLALGGPVLAPVPTFVMYEMTARFVNLEFAGVPLDREFALDADAMLAAVERHQPAVVFIAYPNNPTGNLFDEDAIRRVIGAAPGLVVIDEAYHAFAGRTLMPYVEAYPNVLIMRTLSKLGLAGLRLGFAAADPAWIDELEKVRMPYNINVLTQASAVFALDHIDVFNEQAARIRAERGRVAAGLAAKGYRCFPSDANFILFRCREKDAGDVFRTLLDDGVVIKNLDGAHPALAGCLRVTIGTPDENDRFLEALPGS
ncbi:MAG: histidinol-phosphate transaminase [Gammaproteobacteria bacterium]|nr:histidinol-phosphate transaminase [Gammaproteobacteria bacterium]